MKEMRRLSLYYGSYFHSLFYHFSLVAAEAHYPPHLPIHYFLDAPYSFLPLLILVSPEPTGVVPSTG